MGCWLLESFAWASDVLNLMFRLLFCSAIRRRLNGGHRIFRSMEKNLQLYSESSQVLSPQMNQTILSVSERLTRSEIESLRREKKQLSDYAQKELGPRIKAALQSLVK